MIDARRTRATLLTAALAATAVFAAACSGAQGNERLGPNVNNETGDGKDLPDVPPHIRGTITLVQPGDSVPGADTGGKNPDATVSCPPDCDRTGRPFRSVLVEEHPGGLATGGDKARLTVPAGAAVFRRGADGGLARIDFAALQVGQKVEAWFDGPVAESYPAQAAARAIVVTP